MKNDMTDEEIRNLAEQYVKEVHYDDYFLEEATRVIQWLTKDYCIVPKVEILNQHAWYMQRMKEVSSNRQMNRGKAIALENLFGKEMFEEDNE